MKIEYKLMIIFAMLLGLYLLFNVPVWIYNDKCASTIGRGATWSEVMLTQTNHGFSTRNFHMGYNCYYLEYMIENNEIKSIQRVNAVIKS